MSSNIYTNDRFTYFSIYLSGRALPVQEILSWDSTILQFRNLPQPQSLLHPESKILDSTRTQSLPSRKDLTMSSNSNTQPLQISPPNADGYGFELTGMKHDLNTLRLPSYNQDTKQSEKMRKDLIKQLNSKWDHKIDDAHNIWLNSLRCPACKCCPGEGRFHIFSVSGELLNKLLHRMRSFPVENLKDSVLEEYAVDLNKIKRKYLRENANTTCEGLLARDQPPATFSTSSSSEESEEE